MKKMARRGLSLVLSFLMVASTAFTDFSFVSNAAESHHKWTKVSLSDITSSDSIAITMTTSDGTTYVLPNASATNAGPTAVIGAVEDSTLTIAEGSDKDYAWTITKNTVEEKVVKTVEKKTEAEVTTATEAKLSEDSTEKAEEATETKQEATSEKNDSSSDKKEESTESVSEDKALVEKSSEENLSETVKEDTTEKDAVVDEKASEDDKALKDAETEEDKKETEEVEETITHVFYTITNGSNYLYTNAANSGVRVASAPENLVGAKWNVEDGYLAAKDSKDATRYLGVYTSKPDWRAYTNITGNTKNQSLAFYKLTGENAEVGTQVEAPKASVEPGTVASGTEVELTCGTKDAKIYYNLTGDDSQYKLYKESIVIDKDATIYAYARLDDLKSEVVSFAYKLGNPKPTGNTKGTLLTRELYNGDQVVVYYPAGKKLMTSEATTNGKLKDVAAEPSEDGTLETKDLNAAVLNVSIDENGYYSFKTEDGKYLTGTVEVKEVNGKNKTYANLILTDEKTDNSLWTEEPASEEGKYYLKNAFAKSGSYVQALEYYSGFSLYGFKADKAYEFSFYALEEGEKATKLDYETDKLTVAQWAGNAHYNEVESSNEYISGDKFATNDMLDGEAKYSAIVDGKVSQPWTSAKSSTTGSTSFYMGSTGVVTESDYMQFALSTLGYGNTELSFRMRASNTAAGAFQMQYSTDGENFNNLKTGTYSFKYTAYKKTDAVDENGKVITEPFEVNGSGDITDGIAKTSLAPTYYVNFTFEIPNAAANAKSLYIRLVPTGGLSAKGDKAPAKGGVIRIDSVKFEANPIKNDSIVSLVRATPEAGEVAEGEKLSLSTATEGADIYYAVNGGEFEKYDANEQVTLTKLPATVSAYATKEGLNNSITVNYQYTQAEVAAVKATPNGGAVFAGQRITLKSKTEGANILYRYLTDEELAAEENSGDNTSEEYSTDEASEPEAQSEEVPHDDWIEYSGSFELSKLPCQLQVKATKTGYKDSPVSTLKFTKKTNDKYNIYFGQIHAHTNISDGAGSLEDALKHASNVDNLDYIVITDHSNSIDNEKNSKITENVDTSATDEWTYAHNLVKQYSTDKFTCAYGYEMTWSNGLGHINTYNTPGFQSRTQTEYSTYSTALQNYYAALRTVPDSISQFNHPGTTFGDFQDFSYYSEENDALITMIEVGNGEGTIGSSGYFPSYEYYTRALDKGWHVAPTNNQDNHKGKWGDANTARTVMLSDTNDENAIYDAMRNYRIYATEDNDLSIYYTLDGNVMGSILEKDAVGDNVEIKADIKDPTDSAIGRVEVIVNGGQSIRMENVSTNEETVTFEIPSSYSYYYLKITEDDGDIAVTAPVWVGDVESCGINKTYTNTVLPVKGESLDINVDLYNNESKPFDVTYIDVVLKDVDGKETVVAGVSGEEAGLESISPQGTGTFKTDFVYNEAGQVTYEVTVRGTLDGMPKVYTDKLQVSYAVPEMVTDVLIDGTHYNDYVTGYYGGNMSAFISICAKKNIRAQVETKEITPEMLEKCSLLVVSAPAKKTGTANAGDYTVSHYSDEFLAMVKNYVANGGSVIVCGLADYSDTKDGQTVTEQDKLLAAIGSTIRMGSDEVCDDTNNGGQVYRMYPTTYNMDLALFTGLRDGQKYSQYSGCSVDISNAKATDFVDEAQWLVKGYDTTYSVDCKDASGNPQPGVLENGVKGIKNDNLGDVTFLAAQHTKAGGNIYVAGGVFISDFEVKAEMDNNDSLPYTNHTIIGNILDGVTVELPTSTIAQARAGKMNEVFAVEGYVTSGTDNANTTFFDTIYIQDETGGIDIFPYATPGLAIGTKMRIVGYVSQYQGDKELKIISSKVLDSEPYVWAPKEVDAKAAMDYDANGGSLLKTTGQVTRVEYNDDGTVAEFWLADNSGFEAAIFIDGYIKSATTGVNSIGDFVKVGATVSAAGVLYMHPEGGNDTPVPVFRVRNCDDITLVKEAEPEIEPQPEPKPEPQPQPQPSNETIKKIGKVVKEQVEIAEKVITKVAEKDPIFKAIVEHPVVKTVACAIKSFFGRIFGW